MRVTRRTFLTLTAAGLAGGCGLGSGGLFGPAEPDSLAPEGGYPPAALDTRPLVDQVTALTLETTPGGVILRATGLPATQDHWDPDLVRVGETEGGPEIRYEFRLRPPPNRAPVGTVASRQVTAGAFISAPELRDVRRITVTAARNSRTLTR